MRRIVFNDKNSPQAAQELMIVDFTRSVGDHEKENKLMSLNWRLFQLTQRFRLRLVGAAVLGLGASMAGLGRLALSGYVLGLVFQSQPLSTLVLPLCGVAACILLRAGLEYTKEALGNRTASNIKLRLRQQIY